MPSFLRNAKQHTTEEANESRIVTKNRWVVEAVNGKLNNWLYFKNIVSNVNIPHIEDDFKIISSIINKYHLQRTKNDKSHQILADEMLKRLNLNNQLMEKALLNKRKSFKNSSTDIDNLGFPVLDEEYIKSLCFGVYQLKQAKSYTTEHLNDDGLYEFEFILEETNLIKVKINSRHSSSTKYTSFVRFNSKEVEAYYCDCRSGARTIGTCAHVASIIWYLSIGKYDKNFKDKMYSTEFYSYCKDSTAENI